MSSRLVFGIAVAVLLSLDAAPARPQAPADARATLEKLHRRAAGLLNMAAENMSAQDEEAIAQDLKGAVSGVDAMLKLVAPEGGKAMIRAELAAKLTALRDELAQLATQPARASLTFRLPACLAVLDEVLKTAKPGNALGLDFQGSYTEAKVAEEAVGGHASAMAPPVRQVAAGEDVAADEAVSVELVSRPVLPQKTFCGGPTKDHILESGGTGVALLDYDGDGRLDVYTVNAYEFGPKREKIPHGNTLYRNLGGWKFEDVSKKAGVDAAVWGNGVCAGDYDDDGRLDLYVTNLGPNFLFRNNGNGTFTDMAAKAGVEAGLWSTGCAFFDAEGDGDLDLYVARYMTVAWDEVAKAERTHTWRGGPKVMLGPVGLPGAADVFYENKGDGTFADATEARGLKDEAKSYGFAVVPTDYDNDGWTDLFVANDSNPNFLYRNDGKGKFESTALLAGVAVNAEGRAQAGMGADSGDFDADGDLDFVLTTFAHDTVTIYRNTGGGQFEDAAQASGVAARTYVPMEWGTVFFDADADGDLDIFLADGHIYPQVDEPAHKGLEETYRQKNQLLLNDGGRYRDVSERAGAGMQEMESSRGLAAGDLDDDGDLDLVITNMDAAPTVLENRPRKPAHWAAFRLVKPGKNRFAIGARVTLTAAGRTQMREVRSGGSYMSQSDLRVHFGLGDHAGPVDVEVTLPGQGRWSFKGLPADKLSVLELSDKHRSR